MSEFGYHSKFIQKGEYGEFSKIEEEYKELEDIWNNTQNRVLTACELSDLYGAMEAFAEKTLNIPMNEIVKMSNLTKDVYDSRSIK